jgi:hypothetical protein
VMRAAQQPSGLVENWYGDGNFSRTLQLYALMKSEGIRPQKWVPGLGIGAVRDGARVLFAIWGGEDAKGWTGTVRFDERRHQKIWGFAQNYARLNEYPEWFTVEPTRLYRLHSPGDAGRVFLGAELTLGVPLHTGTWVLEQIPGPPYGGASETFEKQTPP